VTLQIRTMHNMQFNRSTVLEPVPFCGAIRHLDICPALEPGHATFKTFRGRSSGAGAQLVSEHEFTFAIPGPGQTKLRLIFSSLQATKILCRSQARSWLRSLNTYREDGFGRRWYSGVPLPDSRASASLFRRLR